MYTFIYFLLGKINLIAGFDEIPAEELKTCHFNHILL